jgi:hypothetical protein
LPTVDTTPAAIPSPPPHGADLPPRAARIDALRALLGTPDPSVRPLAQGIRATAHAHFDRHVLPLVRAHWPAVEGTAFFDKLRIGACDLYASGPYTALLCAPRRPLRVRLVTDLGNALPLSPALLAQLGRVAMLLLGRFALADQHRRIALVAAFIVVVDHALDHVMPDAPELRGPRLEAVLDGRASPDHPALALARALAVAMSDGLDAADRGAFEAAMARVTEWIRAEVRAMRHEPDPTGLGHRRAGVEGTIDGLLFPVVRWAGEGARAWMYDVSMFVQLMDDWMDAEADARSDRPTPVVTGAWTFDDVAAAWHRSVTGLEGLVRAAGLTSPRYVAFVRAGYVLMMHDVMEAMAARPDA